MPYRFNVKDFGAGGAGSTDDTASIQAAIDAAHAEALSRLGPGQPLAAETRLVFLPAGKYRTTQALRLWAGISLAGEPRSTVILSTRADVPALHGWDGTHPYWAFVPAPPPGQPLQGSLALVNLTLRDLLFAHVGAAPSAAPGIDLIGGGNVRLDDVGADGYLVGLRVQQVQHLRVRSFDCWAPGYCAIWVVNGASDPARPGASQLAADLVFEGGYLGLSEALLGVRDDGGPLHRYRGLYLNGGPRAYCALHLSGTHSAVIEQCAMESVVGYEGPGGPLDAALVHLDHDTPPVADGSGMRLSNGTNSAPRIHDNWLSGVYRGASGAARGRFARLVHAQHFSVRGNVFDCPDVPLVTGGGLALFGEAVGNLDGEPNRRPLFEPMPPVMGLQSDGRFAAVGGARFFSVTDSPPTSGAYRVGDHAVRLLPVPGGVVEWVCVANHPALEWREAVRLPL